MMKDKFIERDNILHVFSVSFSINYFVGDQLKYLKKINGNQYYVTCTFSEELEYLAKKYGFTPLPVSINRKISLVSDILAIIKIYNFIKENNIDKVVGHSPKGALIAMVAAKIAGIKERIYFRHGIFYETSTGFYKTIFRNIDRLTGNLATKVVCVSHAVRKISNIDRLNPDSKNLVLGRGTCNGVDALGKFNPCLIGDDEINLLRVKYHIKRTDIVVGFVGRLVRDKGIKELIDAWELLTKERQDIKLLLVGPFEERDSVNQNTRNYILNEPTVISVGNVENTPIFYSLMDIFILPSYREGFPTVILEASSMKLPIIVTKATGCEEAILENKTGIFTSLNPEDIAQKIIYYLDNEDARKSHGNNGRKFVLENFEQTKIWNIISDKLKI